MKWGEMSWWQMKEVDRDGAVVVIPTGSMEQHGPHLPLEVDAHIAAKLTEDLEKRMPEVLVLPAVWSGVSAHHMDFPGSITIRPRVFIDLLRDICISIYHHGFRRIVLLNGHGGNRSSLEVLGQELYSEFGLTFNLIVYWDLAPDLLKSLKRSLSKGMGHSGEVETSLMLYLAPHLVHLESLPKSTMTSSSHAREKEISLEGVKRYVNIKVHSEVGIDGNPAEARSEYGEQFYKEVLVELEKRVRNLQELPA